MLLLYSMLPLRLNPFYRKTSPASAVLLPWRTPPMRVRRRDGRGRQSGQTAQTTKHTRKAQSVMSIQSGKQARTTIRTLALACMGAALGLAGSAHAVSYTVAGITVSSPDAGFSQPSANTFYFPTGAGITTFTFGDGRGFILTSSEQPAGNDTTRNIVGIPAAGNVINAITGGGGASTVTLRDALSGATLVLDYYYNSIGPARLPRSGRTTGYPGRRW
jgi:hypothetical protein